jgi:hypothetical protein
MRGLLRKVGRDAYYAAAGVGSIAFSLTEEE